MQGHLVRRLFTFAFLVASTGVVAEPARVDASLDRYAAPARRVDIGAGRRLNLRCSGQGAPTVMLDIGLGESSFAWPNASRVPASARNWPALFFSPSEATTVQ